MADECIKCIMLEEFKRIWDYNKEEKETRKETEKVVYEMKESHTQTQFVLKDIQKNVDAQAIATEKNQVALALSTKEYQKETARLTKENQAENAAGFKAIADKKAEEEKAIAAKKEADEKTAIDDKKEAEKIAAQDKKDASKEKRAQTRAIWMVVFVLVVNTVYGLLVKYAPHVIGL